MNASRVFVVIVAGLALCGLGYWLFQETGESTGKQDARVAVETAPIQRGALDDVREFSGSLEAQAVLTVAPKIAGQVASVAVDIGDRVGKGDPLITLDDDEYRQALAEAQAREQVARAQLAQARSDAGTASRALGRVRSLNDRGIAAASELDAAKADAANANAAVAVARATISEASAQLETARLRLGYTTIAAHWPGDDAERTVGQRMAEPGDAVAANTPLLRIVSVNPLTAVIDVPERLFSRLEIGQSARLRVAGGETARYSATVERIAPVFDPDTRRARVELSVPNDDGRLAPGMFVQVGLLAERLENAPIVPRAALVTRGEQQGVFMARGSDTNHADDAGSGARIAKFTPVTLAFTQGNRAALREPADLSGDVVVLGQAQLEDGLEIEPGDDEDDEQ